MAGKDLQRSPGDSKAVWLSLLAIILLSLLLRVPNVSHVLSWDEAFNVNAAYNRGQSIPHDMWAGQLRVHPPIYIYSGVLFEKITGATRKNVALFLEALSILASLGILVLIYLCGADWFDKKTGLLAAFFYAVLPAARVFDTWIKQDALMMFFTLAFLLLFFRKRYLWAGVLLGLALLTKETVLFIVLGTGVFLLISRRFKEIYRLVLSFAVALLLSFWWYLFFSSSIRQFIGLFLGTTQEAKELSGPWYIYLVKAPREFGWIVVALLLLGIFLYLFDFKKEGRPQMVVFLFCLIGVLLLVLSVTYEKTPWYIQPVMAPVAMLAGWSLSRVYDLMNGKNVAIALASVVLIAALVSSALVSFDSYLAGVDRKAVGWDNDKNAAEYINRTRGASIMMDFHDISPVFLFYLDDYDQNRVVYMPAGAPADAYHPGSSIVLVGPGTDPSLYKDRVATFVPDYMVLRSKPFEGPKDAGSLDARKALINDFRKLDNNPRRFGKYLVFDGRKIASALKDSPNNRSP